MANALTYGVSPDNPALLESVELTAREANRPPRALLLQALLQLPRLADERGMISIYEAEKLWPNSPTNSPPGKSGACLMLALRCAASTSGKWNAAELMKSWKDFTIFVLRARMAVPTVFIPSLIAS